jgi:flagellar biosynthesis protein FlhA
VEQEADFYGAMDGASKFVRGDAIAAILITLINVVGGFAIGIAQRGLTMVESLQQYTILSIGDGLVSQIPALIISTAAGILVTRAASKADLGQELGQQLMSYPRALTILGIMMLVMGLVPGLPFTPFLVLGGLALLVGYTLGKHGLPGMDPAAALRAGGGVPAGAAGAKGGAAAGAAEGQTATATADKSGDKLETLLALDPLQIELGYGLVSLADKRRGGDLLDRVTGVRRTFAQEIGVIVPPIRLRDNLQLEPSEYRFLLKGNTIAQGKLMPGFWLAMNATDSKINLKGVPTVEPVFGLPATWIGEAERKTAEVGGFTLVDAASVLVTHLSETVKRHCHALLSRQDVQSLLDNLKETHPTVVNELIPAQLSVGQVQRILQNLLAEGISIRNLSGILEKVSDFAPFTKNPDELSEHARRALGPQITKPYQMPNGSLCAITLDPRLEQALAQNIRQTPNEMSLAMEPGLARHVVQWLSRTVQQMVAAGQPPVVICAPHIRLGFKRFFEASFAELAVLSYSEIPPRVEVQNAGVIPVLE